MKSYQTLKRDKSMINMGMRGSNNNLKARTQEEEAALTTKISLINSSEVGAKSKVDNNTSSLTLEVVVAKDSSNSNNQNKIFLKPRMSSN
jgi:hypothetical protein